MQPDLVAANGRRFAGFAAAVMVFIIDPETRRFLLLSSPPKRARPGWELVNGGIEAGETPMVAVAREVAEEAGPGVRLDVLGAVHSWSWHYDDQIPHLLTLAFAAVYLGGEVAPGEEMSGCEVRWADLDEVRELDASRALIPAGVWLFERALQCFDLWAPLPREQLSGWVPGT